MQPHPYAELAELACEVEELCPDLAAFPSARRVFYVDAVGRRILGDDQELLDAGVDQSLGLEQYVRDRPGDQIAAQFWNNAERATIVAAF